MSAPVRIEAVDRLDCRIEPFEWAFARERRGDTIASTIATFRNSVQQALSKLRGAAAQLELSATKIGRAHV